MKKSNKIKKTITTIPNINNLEEGMIFEKYGDLCNFLGVEPKRGSYLQKQKKDFEKYFEYEKDNKKYRILKVFKIPKTMSDEDVMELLLLHLMASNQYYNKNNNNTLILTKTQLFEKMHLVNNNYRDALYIPDKVSKHINVPKEIVNDISKSLKKSLLYKLNKVIDSLYSQRISFCQDIYMICYSSKWTLIKEDNVFKKVINKGLDTNRINQHTEATENEISFFVAIEKQIMNDLNCTSFNDIIIKGKEQIFTKRKNEELEKYGVSFFYRGLKFIFNKDIVKTSLKQYIKKFILSIDKEQKYLSRLNTNNKKNIYNNAQNKHLRAVKKIEEINNNNNKIKNDLAEIGFDINELLNSSHELEELSNNLKTSEEINNEAKFNLLSLRASSKFLQQTQIFIDYIININFQDTIDKNSLPF